MKIGLINVLNLEDKKSFLESQAERYSRWMAGREKRTSLASPTNMPAPPVPRRSERAGTPVPRASTPVPRAGTPMPNQWSPTPVPRGQRSLTPMPSSRGLKTVETQTPALTKRSVIALHPSSQKRSTANSDSPARLLRNVTPQRLKYNSLLLDGIPIVKRTRSLISVESEASSPSGSFNDAASVDAFFNFNPPDSPLDQRQESFLTPENLPIRRARVRRLSETSNISVRSTRSLSTPRKKTSLILPPESLKETPVIKKKVGRPQLNKTQAKAVTKARKFLHGKRKQKEENTVDTEPETKKLKRGVSKTGKISNPKGTKVFKVMKTVGVKKTNAQGKKPVTTKTKTTMTKRSLKDKAVLIARKKTVQVTRKSQKIVKRQIARQINKNKKENVRADARKTILNRAKSLVTNKKTMKDQLPVTRKRKQVEVSVKPKAKNLKKELSNVKLPDPSEVSDQDGNTDGTVIKRETDKNKEVSNIEEPKMQDAATETIRRTKNLNIKNKPASLPLKKGKKPVKIEKKESPDTVTLKTLTEVSKILEKIAETTKDDSDNEDKNEKSSNVTTPVCESPKLQKYVPVVTMAVAVTKAPTVVTAKTVFLETEVNNPSNNIDLDPLSTNASPVDSSHVSPINTLANKLRHKLSQPSTVNTNADSTQMPTVNGSVQVATAPQNAKCVSRKEITRLPRAMPSAIAPPITPLPIINSLSAAAKQTSSFLRQCDETELPIAKADAHNQYKIRMYNKIKVNNSPHSLIKKSSVNYNVYNNPSLLEKNLPVKALFTDRRAVGLLKDKVSEPETAKQNTDVLIRTLDELDKNENKLDAKVDQTNEKISDSSTHEKKIFEKESGAVSCTTELSSQVSKSPIPEKDKVSDNHSELPPPPPPPPPQPPAADIKTAIVSTVTDSDLTSNKTEQDNKSLDKSDLRKPIEPETDLSSDGSFKTPECSSPTNVVSEPTETEIPKDPSFSKTLIESDIDLVQSGVTENSVAPATTVENKTPTTSVVSDAFSVIPSSLLNPDPSKRPTLPFEEEDLVAKESVLGALGLRSNLALSEEAKAPKVPKLRLVCRPTHKKHRRSANHDSSALGGYKEKTYTVCREGDSYGEWDKHSPTKSSREVENESGTRNLLWYPRMPISNGKALETMVDNNTPEPGVGVGDGLGQDTVEGGEKSSEPLVIPEKSSSFAIHPGRLCEDVCCYCHNKFGLYDTPLHVAQLKGDEKQQTVLTREPLLSLESCLCDACFRHLDRPGIIRGPKPPQVKQKPQPNQTCCFNGCYQPAAHTMMRKWKRRARSLLPEDQQDPKITNWICDNHYAELARIGACGLCHRRLNSQQMYKLETSAVPPLNRLLRQDRLPVTLDGTMSLCKKCRYYTSLRLRTEDYTKLNSNNRIFLREHRNRVLKVLNVDPSSLPDVFAEQEKPKKQPKKKDKALLPAEVNSTSPLSDTSAEQDKSKKQPKKKEKASPPAGVNLTPTLPSTPTVAESSIPTSTAATTASKQQLKPKLRIKFSTPTRKMPTNARMSTGNSRMPPPAPQIKMSPVVSSKNSATQVKISPATGLKLPTQTRISLQARPIAPAPPKLSASSIQISPVLSRLAEKGDVRKVTSQNSGASLLSRIGLTKYPSPTATITSQTPQVTIVPVATTRPSATQVSSQQQSYKPVPVQRDFPSSSEVGMTSKFDFQPADDSVAWQKVNATFQFDRKTRQLWNNLHAPYGSYTSFLRHLVLLENHWRSGDLILSPTASNRSRQYLNSVQNRIQAYEGVPSEQEASLGSVPLISDVRSLATGETAESWAIVPPKV